MIVADTGVTTTYQIAQEQNTLAVSALTCGIALYNSVTLATALNTIAFGTLQPGGAAPTSNLIVDDNAGGTVPTNILIAGSYWQAGPNSFGYSNTLWNPTSAGAGVGNALQLGTANLVDTKILVPSSSANSIYTGVVIPPSVPTGTFSANIIIENEC